MQRYAYYAAIPALFLALVLVADRPAEAGMPGVRPGRVGIPGQRG
ncbi:MAG: hypothetical protein HC869_06375, partial [Rhodospirillales bacterium]|nr:hypothetical protein [Rhodospirillales bacterium]